MTILKSPSNTTSGSSSTSGCPFQAALLRSRQSSTAGSTLRGIVKVDVEAARKEGYEVIKAKLRVEQRSTYYQDYGGLWQDYRSQKRQLYTDEITIWTANSLDPPDAPPEDNEINKLGDLKLYPDEKDVPPSTSPSSSPPVVASSSSTTTAGISSFPFAFVLPTSEEQLKMGNVLPPSFRSGPRTNSKLIQTINFIRGTEVGYVRYFVKVTASGGRARYSIRKILPFIYLPPRVTDPSAIPPTLVLADEVSLPPSAPARPSDSDGWKTHAITKDWREGMSMFGKKHKAVVKLSLPSLPAFPSSTPIPYRASLLLLSPPATSTSLSTINLPSPSALSFLLVQELWTRARGNSQTITQTISRVGDNVGGRVWYGEAKFWDGTKRESCSSSRTE